jgi:hypothetical protein
MVVRLLRAPLPVIAPSAVRPGLHFFVLSFSAQATH